MKRFVWVMLVCITTASSVFADSLDAGLGAERASLSPEQIAARSDLLEASTSFALLRFPEARLAPGRIFKPGIWDHIQSAAREYDLDPMILAGMIFIESYGDPQAKSPTGPAGIAQLTKGSARELGLSTGKKVRIGSKAVKKTRWVGKGKNRRKVVQTVQQPIYKTLDERYVPARAISAMARRLSNRRAWLGGKIDFAIAEYHMGAGRMANLLSAYFGQKVKVSDVTEQMSGTTLSYAELYWMNTPYFRPEVYEALDDLNEVDYSPTYYFRVRQAMRLLRTYRESPEEYARLATVYGGKFGWAVLPSWQWSFVTEPLTSVLPAPPPSGILHQDGAERFALLPEIAISFGVRAGSTPMSAERSTIGSALFVAQQLKQLQGDRYTGFEIGRMIVPSAAGCGGSGYDGDEDDDCAPLHTLGWAFDIDSKDLSKTDRRDLKFILNDLRQAGLLAYIEEDKESTYHVVRHPDHAARFEQFYWDAMAGSPPSEQRRVAYRISEPVVVTVTAALNDSEQDLGASRVPNVLAAITSLFSRIYDYFA
jgi:hypothetical protein